MKKWLFIFLALLIFAVWVLFNPPEDSGYLLITIGGKSLETSVWFAVLTLISFVVVLWFVWQLLKGSVRVVRRLAEFFNPGGSERAQKRTASGLIDFIEGNWEQAHTKLLRAAPKMDVPLINYLAAARSAWELGRKTESLEILQKTLIKVPGSELAVALTQARMELQDQHYEEALQSLLKVKTVAPQNPVMLDLLRQVYLARADWEGIERILDRLRSLKICKPEELRELELKVHSHYLREAGKAARLQAQRERLSLMQSAWGRVPGKWQKDAALVQVFAEQLAECAEDQEAELQLRKLLSREWHPEMIPLYGRLRGADLRAQMRILENWREQYPQDAQLLLALGRLSLRNQLWGKARDCFRESLRLMPSAETSAELARLLDAMGEEAQSYQAYQQALDLCLPPLPDIPLPSKKNAGN